jgi:hypothetical protein
MMQRISNGIPRATVVVKFQGVIAALEVQDINWLICDGKITLIKFI